MTELTILDSRGDTTITWDDSDQAAKEEARQTVADLKTKGYMFFLVDGTPADEVSAGAGKLVVRRLKADEVIETESAETNASLRDRVYDRLTETVEKDAAEKQQKQRGRPRKQIVAARPVAGG